MERSHACSQNIRRHQLLQGKSVLPKIKLHIAVRAILIFWKEPKMWIFLREEKEGGVSLTAPPRCASCCDTHVSASTMRVFVTFSMVNLVFPPFPAILPMALDRWSPFSGFTAETPAELLGPSWAANAALANRDLTVCHIKAFQEKLV